MPIDTKWLVNLWKEVTWADAKKKFFGKVIDMKSQWKIINAPISWSEYLKIINDNFTGEIEQSSKKKWFIFKKSVDEHRIIVSYDDEPIWFFELDDNSRKIYWEFIKSLVEFEEDTATLQVKKFIEECLRLVLSQDELRDLAWKIITPGKKEFQRKTKQDRKQAKKNDKINKAYSKNLSMQTLILSQDLTTTLLTLQDHRIQLFTSDLVRYVKELNQLTNKVSAWDLDNRKPKYNEISNNIILTTCRIKLVLDESKSSLAKDYQLVSVLYNLWFKRWWRDREIKAIMKWLKQEKLWVGMMWTTKQSETWPVQGQQAAMQQQYPTYQQIQSQWVPPITPYGSPSSWQTASQAVIATAAWQTTITTWTWSKETIKQTPWINQSVERNWDVYATIDVTKVTAEWLVAWYVAAAENAAKQDTAPNAINNLYNYSLAIVLRVIERPNEKNQILTMLGWWDRIKGNQLFLNDIMKRVFLDQDMQKKIKATYAYLKRERDHNRYPPEWDVGNPDARKDSDDWLLQVAFTRAIPDQIRYLRSYFQRNTDWNQSWWWTESMKVAHFLWSLWVNSIADYVRNNVSDDLDLEWNITAWEAFEWWWISQPWWIIDYAEHEIKDWIDEVVPYKWVASMMKWTVWILSKWAKWATKFAPLALLTYWARKVWSWVFKTVWAMFSKPPEWKNRFQNVWWTMKDSFLSWWTVLPFAWWLWLSTLDKRPGTKKVRESVAELWDDDVAAKKKALDDNLRAVSIDRETYSTENVLQLYLWDKSLRALQNMNWIIFDTSETIVNLNSFPQEELQKVPGIYNVRRDKKWETIQKNLGSHLRQEYNLDKEMRDHLMQRYPDEPLQVLLDRYKKQSVYPIMQIWQLGIDESIISTKELKQLAYLPEYLFQEKVLDLAFITQQYQKLNHPVLLETFVTNTWMPLPCTPWSNPPTQMSANEFLSHVKSTQDSTWSTFAQWFKEQCKLIAQFDPADWNGRSTQSLKLLQWLYCAISQQDLFVEDWNGNLNTAWSTDPVVLATGDKNALGIFFCDPTIWNGGVSTQPLLTRTAQWLWNIPVSKFTNYFIEQFVTRQGTRTWPH